MITANFSAYSTYVTDSLFQWDQNRVLRVTGLNLKVKPEVHFSNANMNGAIPVQADLVNHVVVASIPNSLLQEPLRIYAHIGIYEGDEFKVVELVEIPVKPRKRPADYELAVDDYELYSFKRLENMINQINETWVDKNEQQIGAFVTGWLDDHPEATTTVQDHSLSVDKMIVGTLGYVTPQMFGAKGDGVTDDTVAFAACLAAGKNITVPEGVYLIDAVETLPETVISFINATLKRRTHGMNDALITFGENNAIYGNLTVDGDKASATVNTESGVQFADGCVSYGVIVSMNNTRHGFIIGSDNEHYMLRAYDNGLTGTDTGDGYADGVYICNGKNTILHKCESYNNKRNGVTITTNNGEAQDQALTENVVLRGVVAYDNSYCDIDVEGVARASVYGASCTGDFAASNSSNLLVEDCKVGTFYASGSDRVTVRGMELRPIGSVTNCFYLSGADNVVENVHLYDTAGTYTGNTFNVADSVGCILKNVVIENGYNAFVAQTCRHVENVEVKKATNRLRTVNGVVLATNTFRVNNGLIETQHNSSSSMKGNIGDRIINTEPTELGGAGSKYVITHWVCVAANTWAACHALTGN